MIDCDIRSVAKLVNHLKRGSVVVFPTETSYGIGCDAANQKAVDRIYKIKGRTRHKPLLVVASSKTMARRYLVWNKLLDKLASKYWPGPITIVGRYKKSNLVRGVVSAEGTVAVRVTAYPWLKKTVWRLGRPIVATSANIAGAHELYAFEQIKQTFVRRRHRPDIIVDGGVLPKVAPTTVVSVVSRKLEILRQGEVGVKISRR